MGFVLYPGRVPEMAAGVVSYFRKSRWSSPVEVCASMDTLIERLLQIPISCEVVVAVTDREELHHLAPTWRRLLAPKLILILLRWEDETVKEAFELYPSFLTSLEEGLSDVSLVLEKIDANRIGNGGNGTAGRETEVPLCSATARPTREERS